MPAIRDIEFAELAERGWIEGEGWATIYVPVTRPMTWRPPRSAKRGLEHRYREVASAPRSLRLASQTALALAARELGMRRPRLRWFGAAGPNDTADFTSNKDIIGRIGAVNFTVWCESASAQGRRYVQQPMRPATSGS